VTIAYLARLLEKRLWSYGSRINALGAARLERDREWHEEVVPGGREARLDEFFVEGGRVGF
jgi:hypothetical protein